MFVWIISVLVLAAVVIVAALIIGTKKPKPPADDRETPAPEPIRRGKFLNR